MTERQAFILTTRERRKAVALIVGSLEKFSRVEIKPPQRTVDQNSAMWPALTDVSEQHLHNGIKLSPADWRLVFLDAFWRMKGEELRLVPNLDGTGFVPLSGRSTSDLSVSEMSDYIELIKSTGASWGVQFHDGQGAGVAEQAPPRAA
jgi:hypothetical protein